MSDLSKIINEVAKIKADPGIEAIKADRSSIGSMKIAKIIKDQIQKFINSSILMPAVLAFIDEHSFNGTSVPCALSDEAIFKGILKNVVSEMYKDGFYAPMIADIQAIVERADVPADFKHYFIGGERKIIEADGFKPKPGESKVTVKGEEREIQYDEVRRGTRYVEYHEGVERKIIEEDGFKPGESKVDEARATQYVLECISFIIKQHNRSLSSPQQPIPLPTQIVRQSKMQGTKRVIEEDDKAYDSGTDIEDEGGSSLRTVTVPGYSAFKAAKLHPELSLSDDFTGGVISIDLPEGDFDKAGTLAHSLNEKLKSMKLLWEGKIDPIVDLLIKIHPNFSELSASGNEGKLAAEKERIKEELKGNGKVDKEEKAGQLENLLKIKSKKKFECDIDGIECGRGARLVITEQKMTVNPMDCYNSIIDNFAKKIITVGMLKFIGEIYPGCTLGTVTGKQAISVDDLAGIKTILKDLQGLKWQLSNGTSAQTEALNEALKFVESKGLLVDRFTSRGFTTYSAIEAHENARVPMMADLYQHMASTLPMGAGLGTPVTGAVTPVTDAVTPVTGTATPVTRAVPPVRFTRSEMTAAEKPVVVRGNMFQPRVSVPS